MSRRRVLMFIKGTRYKYLPGGKLTYSKGELFNNNIKTGSEMFTVKMGFRIHSTSGSIILAENWPNSSNGWEIGISGGAIYYKESYNGSSKTTTFTDCTPQPDVWYDLKFEAARDDGSSNLYCSLDGGVNRQTIKASRWRSQYSKTRDLVFGNSNGTVDIRGLVGCIGCGSGGTYTGEWNIDAASTSSAGYISDTSGRGDDWRVYASPAARYDYE